MKSFNKLEVIFGIIPNILAVSIFFEINVCFFLRRQAKVKPVEKVTPHK